jgi:hypothetical protein
MDRPVAPNYGSVPTNADTFMPTVRRFERKHGALMLGTDADLSLGVAVAGKCAIPITWSGFIEIETQPYIGADLAVKFHVVNIDLYNSAHQKSVLLRGFDLIKSHFVPRLEDFSYDLQAPLRQLEDLMQAAAAPDVAERVKTAISTMRPISAVVPGDEGLKFALELNVPEIATPARSVVPAPLSPDEIAAWQAMLDDWDAFIVFAIKQLAGTVGDKQFRAQLFDLLLDSRYRLVEALAQPQVSAGPDPIRLIFIDEWTGFARSFNRRRVARFSAAVPLSSCHSLAQAMPCLLPIKPHQRWVCVSRKMTYANWRM